MIKAGLPTNPMSNAYFTGGKKANGGGVAFFWSNTLLPDLTSADRAIGFQSTAPKYWNGTSWAAFSSGAGGYTTWDELYANDKSLTIDSTTLTFSLTHATNNGLTFTSGAGTGHLIQITNSGSGNDINGTSDTWSVTKAGLATFATGSILGGTTKFGTGSATGTITSNGAYDLVLETNSGTNSSKITITDAANGNITNAMNGTGKFVISGTTTHNDAFQVAAGDVVVTLGSLTLSDDQDAISFALTNNTATTIGNASSTGVVNWISTSLTTGALVNLELTEGTLAGGWYLRGWDATAGSASWSIGEKGAMILKGSNATTAVATFTAGKFVMSDGNVAITSSDTTDFVSLTNDSLLANNALIVKGSGIFTGTGTSSFVAITPTGATTGTGLYIALAAATTLSYALDITTSTTTGTAARLTNTGILTGVGAALSIIADAATTAGASAGEGVVNVSVDGLTTGAALNIESLSNELMTSGVLAHFDHSAVGTTIAAKTGALVSLTSSMTESGTSTQDFDMLSIVRTSVHDTAGTLTATGSLLYLENVATETGATLTDTVNGLEVVMDAQGTGTGVKITHPATTGKSIDVIASTTTGTVALLTMNSLTTTGVGLSLTNTGTGMTSGSVLRVASGTTSAVATNGVVSLFATGAFTSTAVTDGFVRVNANSTLTGTAVAINGNSFTSGIGLNVGDTGTGMTSGSLIRATSATTGAVATNGILSVQATGAYTSTANMGILAAIANTTTAGTVAYISGTSMIGGTLLFLNATAATLTGKYIQCYDGAADDFSVGQYGATIIAGNASGTAALTLTNGNILLSSGNATFTAGTTIFTPQAILNANTAISVTHGVTKIANNGASTHTLADGVEGQTKTIVCTVYTADAVITPANLANGTTITLNAVGDACDLVFLGTEWWVTNLYGTAALA
jgi:hypothetical protein